MKSIFPSRHICLAVVPAVLLLAAPALAQEPPGRIFSAQGDPPPAPTGGPARLEYTAPDGCPTEAELRSTAASRMGHDPFVPPGAPAGLLVRIRVTRQGAGHVAAVEMRDSTGRVLWTRPPLGDADCRRLVGVIATITVPTLLEPPQAQAQPTAPAPPPPPPPIAPAPPAAPPADTRPATTPRPAFRIGARGGAVFGAAPGPAASFALDVGAGWEHFSLNLEGRADLPASGMVDEGVRLRTSVLAGSLVPCGHYKWFVGCGIVTVGVLRDEGVNLDVPARDAAAYFAAGIRAGVEFPVVPAFAFRVSGDVLLNLHPIAAQADVEAGRMEVWRTGPFAALIGGGVVARFGGPR